MPNEILHRLLAAIFGGLPGYLNFRALPGAASAFVAVNDRAGIDAFLTRYHRRNLYLGVALRRDASSGALTNCSWLPALFCDLDFCKIPERMARYRLATCPLAPSLTVQSGGGIHAWWLLRDPLDLQEPEHAALAKTLLRGLALALHADIAVAEAARILRVPGTFNFKHGAPRRVQLESFDPARRYALTEFTWVPVEVPPWSAPLPPRPPRVHRSTTLSVIERARRYLETMPLPIIGQGSHRDTFTAACRLRRGFDLPASDCEALLWQWAGSRPGWTYDWIAEKVRLAEIYGRDPWGYLR